MLKYEIIPVTVYEQNCSVLWCSSTKQAIVCDPGGDLDRIEAVINKHDLQVINIVLTHGHFDHAGCAGDFATSRNIKIIGPHKDDMFWIESLPEQFQRYGLGEKPSPFIPDVFLNDGDKVNFGEIILEVIHCPGHTPGHVVFYHRDSRLAIVGDVLFQGSIGRTDFPRGNHNDLINAIRNKLFPLVEDTGADISFISGHGAMSTFSAERTNNPFVGDAVCG